MILLLSPLHSLCNPSARAAKKSKDEPFNETSSTILKPKTVKND
jgi:hypothetical protein